MPESGARANSTVAILARMSFALITATLAVAASADFQSLLDRVQARQDTPGISAVVSHGDATWFAGGSGVADLATMQAMTADTVLYAGSISKVYTAVLALQLVEAGKLRLDDVVDQIGTRSDDVEPITVHHLLTHASGLGREGDFGYWFSGVFPNREALLDYLTGAPRRSAPGATLHYSNVGYAALGTIIEDVTELSFGEALEQRIAQPLELSATGAPGPVSGIAPGYTPSGRIIPSRERPFAGVTTPVGDRYLREYHDAAAMSPAFGVYTSAQDLGALARFLLSNGNDSVLSAEMRRRMRTRQASGWGLGLKIGRFRGSTVARHEGWFAAHRSHLLLDADTGLSIVVMTNSDGGAPALAAEALYIAAREKLTEMGDD